MSTITRDELKEVEVSIPEYYWIEDEEASKLSPIKRPMAKIQKAHAEFTPYQAYQMIGKLQGFINKRNEENEADQNKIDLFKAELAIIEEKLNIPNLEEQFKNEQLAEAAISQLQNESKNNK